MPRLIKVAARISPLSQAQVKEVHQLLSSVGSFEFLPIFLESKGDVDLKTPLTELAKTDFFTQNIDELVISGDADIAIHSAKDLPEKILEDLEIIAITEGIDPRDSLVSFNYTLEMLPNNAVIGTCSDRRTSEIKRLRPDVIIKPIRGTINHRIDQLKEGHFDAIILAEAGLLRLNLDVPRQILNIEHAPLQGKLAIVARKDHLSMKSLFKALDSRLCG